MTVTLESVLIWVAPDRHLAYALTFIVLANLTPQHLSHHLSHLYLIPSDCQSGRPFVGLRKAQTQRQHHKTVAVERPTGEAAGKEVNHYFVSYEPWRKAAPAVDDSWGGNGRESSFLAQDYAQLFGLRFLILTYGRLSFLAYIYFKNYHSELRISKGMSKQPQDFILLLCFFIVTTQTLYNII